jgi:hypothetical protein
MAKLSARGRQELARVSKETDVEGAPDRLVLWRRKTYALMSDRTILVKDDVRFTPSTYGNGKPEFHSYGWKVKAKAREGVTPEQFLAVYVKAGFTVLKS